MNRFVLVGRTLDFNIIKRTLILKVQKKIRGNFEIAVHFTTYDSNHLNFIKSNLKYDSLIKVQGRLDISESKKIKLIAEQIDFLNNEIKI